eukprot:3791496-Rhodomonas_salina.1
MCGTEIAYGQVAEAGESAPEESDPHGQSAVCELRAAQSAFHELWAAVRERRASVCDMTHSWWRYWAESSVFLRRNSDCSHSEKQ